MKRFLPIAFALFGALPSSAQWVAERTQLTVPVTQVTAQTFRFSAAGDSMPLDVSGCAQLFGRFEPSEASASTAATVQWKSCESVNLEGTAERCQPFAVAPPDGVYFVPFKVSRPYLVARSTAPLAGDASRADILCVGSQAPVPLAVGCEWSGRAKTVTYQSTTGVLKTGDLLVGSTSGAMARVISSDRANSRLLVGMVFGEIASGETLCQDPPACNGAATGVTAGSFNISCD